MSALMVRPEEEVTPWEGAAMVLSKALEAGERGNQQLQKLVGRLYVNLKDAYLDL